MSKTTSALFALGLLSGTAFAVSPAAAQDRTPPDSAIQDLVPTIDLRPGQVFQSQRDMYGMREGRSSYRRDQSQDWDR